MKSIKDLLELYDLVKRNKILNKPLVAIAGLALLFVFYFFVQFVSSFVEASGKHLATTTVQEKSDPIIGENKSTVESLQKLAQSGDAVAQYMLGVVYDVGVPGVEQDTKFSMQWFSKINRQALPMSEYYAFGLKYNAPQSTSGSNDALIISSLFAAAKEGSAKANYILGITHADGLYGQAANASKAFQWFEKGRQEDAYLGQRLIIIESEQSFNTLHNICSGYNNRVKCGVYVNWVRLAAEGGKSPAQFIAALTHVYSLGESHSYEGALRLFNKAAANGSEAAKNFVMMAENPTEELLRQHKDQGSLLWLEMCAKKGNIGPLRRLGEKLWAENNRTQAYQYFIQAADQGDEPSKKLLAQHYIDDWQLSPAELEPAFTWYLAHKDTGGPKILFSLGFMYSQGWGVSAEYGAALNYFKKAQRTDPRAQRMLDILEVDTSSTLLCPIDNSEYEISWLRLAASSGNNEARYNLALSYANCLFSRSTKNSSTIMEELAKENYAPARWYLANRPPAPHTPSSQPATSSVKPIEKNSKSILSQEERDALNSSSKPESISRK